MDKEIVLITGICGRIGSALQKKLAKRYRVVGFDRTPCVGFISCDLTSDESVEKAMAKVPEGRIASVVHLAAYYSFTEKDSKLYDNKSSYRFQGLLRFEPAVWSSFTALLI